MPIYDYICGKCNKKFNVTMSITAHGKKRVQCPKCSSKAVMRSFQPFFAHNFKKELKQRGAGILPAVWWARRPHSTLLCLECCLNETPTHIPHILPDLE